MKYPCPHFGQKGFFLSILSPFFSYLVCIFFSGFFAFCFFAIYCAPCFFFSFFFGSILFFISSFS